MLGSLLPTPGIGPPFPLRCGTLTCPTCGPTVRWAVKEGIREAVEIFGLDHLWTITMPGEAYKGRGHPLRSRADLMEGWNVIRTRLAQEGAFRDFVAVVEFRKDGMAYLHVGSKGFVPWELVNRLAKQAGLGFVWVSRPRTRRRGRSLTFGNPQSWRSTSPSTSPRRPRPRRVWVPWTSIIAWRMGGRGRPLSGPTRPPARWAGPSRRSGSV